MYVSATVGYGSMILKRRVVHQGSLMARPRGTHMSDMQDVLQSQRSIFLTAIYPMIPFCVACLSRKDTWRSLCPLLLLSVVVVCRENWITFGSNFHMHRDFNQSSAIDATRKPSFVDEVKGHISRSKVI